MSDFYNWASDWHADYEKSLGEVSADFASFAAFLGEDDVKEPSELFATLQRFLLRFEAIVKEMAKAEAEAATGQQRQQKKQTEQLKSRAQQTTEDRGGRRLMRPKMWVRRPEFGHH